MGRNPKLSKDEILSYLKDGSHPVWTSGQLAEKTDVSRKTAKSHLEDMADEGEIESMDVGNTTAYYCRGVETDYRESSEGALERDIKREFEDRWVGLRKFPWTARLPNEGPAEAGDKVQIQVEGTRGDWSVFKTRNWENRREELEPKEQVDDEVQALVSGELYGKPTVPIEHVDYPDHYDLEGEIRAEWEEVGEEGRRVLMAYGMKKHLIKPQNDAVFLKDVSVDWISPISEDTDRSEEHPGPYMGGEEPGL